MLIVPFQLSDWVPDKKEHHVWVKRSWSHNALVLACLEQDGVLVKAPHVSVYEAKAEDSQGTPELRLRPDTSLLLSGGGA